MQDLKLQRKIICFDFGKYRPKRYEETAFRFDFGPCKVPQPENMHFNSHAFSGWGTSRGPKLNLKAFFS